MTQIYKSITYEWISSFNMGNMWITLNFAGPGWLELDWKCPGRRPPTPPDEADNGAEEEDTAQDDEKDMAFDFEDEFSSSDNFNTPQQRRLGGGGLKGSARKKTTSLDGVLSNMRRHKIIEDNMETEKEAPKWWFIVFMKPTGTCGVAWVKFSVLNMFSQCFLFNVNFYCFVSLLHIFISHVLQLRSWHENKMYVLYIMGCEDFMYHVRSS